jgi:hypothetical protein
MPKMPKVPKVPKIVVSLRSVIFLIGLYKIDPPQSARKAD